MLLLLTRTDADPDLWGHVRFGLDMLATGTLPAVDPYSFTSDVPWVNHEWLSELAMGMAYRVGGNAGLVALKLACIAVIVLALHGGLRRFRTDPRTYDVFMTLVLISIWPRLVPIRPQIFSFACFAILLTIVRGVREGRRHVEWALPPLFAVWVNLHGGWIVGLAAVAIWLPFTVAAAATARRRILLAAAATASLAATLVNPYGFGLWRFLLNTVGLSRPVIYDWQPFSALPWPILLLEAVFPLFVAVRMIGSRTRPPVAHAGVALLLAALTWRVSRVDVFFHLSLALLIVPSLHAARHPAAAPADARPAWRPAQLAIVGVTTVLFIAAAAANARHVHLRAGLQLDAGALAYLRDVAEPRRLLTWYNWGEYALWHLAPSGVRVSMDGRRETVYSEQVVDDHFAFYDGEARLLRYPDAIGADAIWLPATMPVVPRLVADGWREAYRSDVSVVLVRGGGTREPQRHKGVVSAGVFPGP
ncbi:MAG TPA: hypothetical protein VK886_02105 [Vicinamibacterales bacterium]|nr:hypothetical protein [Vicinamibacterales bacterium]